MNNTTNRLLRRNFLVLLFVPLFAALFYRLALEWLAGDAGKFFNRLITLQEWVHRKLPITRKFAK